MKMSSYGKERYHYVKFDTKEDGFMLDNGGKFRNMLYLSTEKSSNRWNTHIGFYILSEPLDPSQYNSWQEIMSTGDYGDDKIYTSPSENIIGGLYAGAESQIWPGRYDNKQLFNGGSQLADETSSINSALSVYKGKTVYFYFVTYYNMEESVQYQTYTNIADENLETITPIQKKALGLVLYGVDYDTPKKVLVFFTRSPNWNELPDYTFVAQICELKAQGNIKELERLYNLPTSNIVSKETYAMSTTARRHCFMWTWPVYVSNVNTNFVNVKLDEWDYNPDASYEDIEFNIQATYGLRPIPGGEMLDYDTHELEYDKGSEAYIEKIGNVYRKLCYVRKTAPYAMGTYAFNGYNKTQGENANVTSNWSDSYPNIEYIPWFKINNYVKNSTSLTLKVMYNGNAYDVFKDVVSIENSLAWQRPLTDMPATWTERDELIPYIEAKDLRTKELTTTNTYLTQFTTLLRYNDDSDANMLDVEVRFIGGDVYFYIPRRMSDDKLYQTRKANYGKEPAEFIQINSLTPPTKTNIIYKKVPNSFRGEI